MSNSDLLSRVYCTLIIASGFFAAYFLYDGHIQHQAKSEAIKIKIEAMRKEQNTLNNIAKDMRLFRKNSYMLMGNVNRYDFTIITHKTDCIVTNSLIKNRHELYYERFINSCEFIWAEADTIHRKFNKNKKEMAGVAIFENDKMFRYYPVYQYENDSNVLMIN